MNFGQQHLEEVPLLIRLLSWQEATWTVTFLREGLYTLSANCPDDLPVVFAGEASPFLAHSLTASRSSLADN